MKGWIRSNRVFWTVLCLAFVMRVAVALITHGLPFDMRVFGLWAETLTTVPLDQFYAEATNADHLPGDLYLHALIAHLYQLGGGSSFQSDAYRLILCLVPAVFDMVIAVLLWWIVRTAPAGGELVARGTALAYALNPAVIFLSSAWGQWDSFSGAMLLAGLGIVWVRPRRWVAGVPLLVWAALVKPPLALIATIGLLTLFLLDRRRGQSMSGTIAGHARGIAGALVVALTMALALIVPFGTGLPGMGLRWSLSERMGVALDTYPYTTMGAANIWVLLAGSRDRHVDNISTFLGLTPQQWGMLLLAATIFWAVIAMTRWWRHMSPLTLVAWAMSVAGYAFYLLPTRSHERYLFPGLLMLLLLGGCLRWERRIALTTAAVSVVYLLNLMGVYYLESSLADRVLFVSLAAANMGLFAVLSTLPLWWTHDDEDEAEAAGTEMPVYADDAETEMVLA